ncbi:hypothetical protein BDY24DRAFT_405334 [Mrakia frigida]|uniref:uncharacterized protein n=1 Tax=Mrakia frigida TaxID=29902 RepID=UPI003FCC22F2
MLSPLSTSLLRPLPVLNSRTFVQNLLPLQHRSQTTTPPKPPPSSSSPFPTSYKPYTPKPRPPTPIKYPPPSVGLHPWANARPGSKARVGFETVGGASSGTSTEGWSIGEKMVHYSKRANWGQWAYSDKQGWKPLAFKFEIVFFGVLCWAVWKWNQAAENDFASNPIDYDLEKKMADQWNRSNATNKRWRAAGTQEEKDLIAKEEAQRYIDISQGKITIPTYPRRPGDDKHWWSRS